MDKEFDKKQFAARLKEIRKAKGLTQEELCELTGLEISNYSKMETGKIAPSMASLKKLVICAGFVPNELFEYDHLETEESLDKVIAGILENFSLGQKQLLYKIIRNIEEFKNS